LSVPGLLYTFQASLNPWESGVVAEELQNGAICWLGNVLNVLIALGVSEDGHREIISACEGGKEDTAATAN